MEDGLFQRESKRYIDMIYAAIATGRAITYNGWLNGQEVIVLGYRQDLGDDKLHSRPLAIVMTDEVFDRLDVQAEKVKEER